VWGGAGPGGFDCSGLVYWAARAVGVKGMPRTSEQQWAFTEHISERDLQPGDLVFEQWPGDQAAPGHVAIYTGKGRIEEAAQQGVPVHEVPWSPGQVSAAGGQIIGYGRIPGLGLGPATATLTGGLLGFPSEVVGFFSGAGAAVDWLIQPSHWIRMIAGFTGALAILGGVYLMSHAGGQVSA